MGNVPTCMLASIYFLLACSAETMEVAYAATASKGHLSKGSPVASRPLHVDNGLPALPSAAGSADSKGAYVPMPADAREILTRLNCKVEDAITPKVARISGNDGASDFMVTDRRGSGYRYWIRSFTGSAGATGYLAQLNGCPARTIGMRAYIAKDDGALEDITSEILDRGGFPDEAAMKKYADQEASGLFALIGQLDRVPVVRWIAEADPDRGLRTDKRTFGRGNYVHGGFLLWTGDKFEVRQKVPAAVWLCDNPKAPECIDDPFVEGR